MKEKLTDLTMEFSLNILKMLDDINGHYSLKNQIERSATSIGANVREARYAQSKADFVSKLHISLKECYETEYWLELFERAGIVKNTNIKGLQHDCGVIRKMLISSINTVKSKE